MQDKELSAEEKFNMFKRKREEDSGGGQIVDAMFQNFITSKLQDVERDSKSKKHKAKTSSVDEINKLLDTEINSMSKKDREKVVKTEHAFQRPDFGNGHHDHDRGIASAANDSHISVFEDVAKTAPVIDIKTEPAEMKQPPPPLGPMLPPGPILPRSVGAGEAKDEKKGDVKKGFGGFKNFGIKLSATSAELIQSGAVHVKGKRLEEGEVLSSDSENSKSSDSLPEDDDDDDDEGDDIDNLSETGSINDSDTDTRSKSKSRRKKKKKKEKKKKKHRSKEKEPVEEQEEVMEKQKEKEKEKSKEREKEKEKEKSKDREKEKDKDKSASKRKSSTERSKSPKKSRRSRSHSREKHKSRHKSPDKKDSKSKSRKSRSRSRDRKSGRRSEKTKDRSRSRDRSSRKRRSRSKGKRSRSRSPKRRSRSPKRRSRSPKKRSRSPKRRSRSPKRRSRSPKRRSRSPKRRSRSPKRRSRSRSPRKRSRSPRRRKSRSRSPRRRRSRSLSPAIKSKFGDFDAFKFSRGSSRRSRSRSRSKSPKGKKESKAIKDLRCKIDKAKLREIAIKNALTQAQVSTTPLAATLKAGGKSVEELTQYCKKIQEKEDLKRKNRNEYDSSSEEEDLMMKDSDDELNVHPFKIKEPAPIVMDIKNAKQLPLVTPAERIIQASQLRTQFPVSSGSDHRNKESEWVPVVPTEKTLKPGTYLAIEPPPAAAAATAEKAKSDKVFEEVPVEPVDISAIVSERLNAVRKLAENPHDVAAKAVLSQAQKKASQWAQSKHLPGQFLGSTGANIMSQEEIIGNKRHQAWIKKDVFTSAAPVSGGIGMFLLQKMGWKQGEGLGKTNEGRKEPLMLDFKIDRRGLLTQGEGKKSNPQPKVIMKDLSGKHPVSALGELCNKRRWGPPTYELIHESGPAHRRDFLYKVTVNKTTYQPSIASTTKKVAKSQAATVVLQQLGLVPLTS